MVVTPAWCLPRVTLLLSAALHQPGDVSSAASASSCGLEHASPLEPFDSGAAASGAGLAFVKQAVGPEDLANLLAAERAAWADPFIAAHGLANHTRRITSSPVSQSVTWLHRQREAASGAIERVESAALAAQRDAGWGLAETFGEGALSVRCIESIRYAVPVADKKTELQAAARGSGDVRAGLAGTARNEEGWHTDEWSVLTLVVVLSTSADLVGGDMQLDRGGGAITSHGLDAGDMILFRSWDAHRSTPVLQGERHILVIEFWQGPPTTASSAEGRPADLPGGRRVLCGPAVAADAASAALLWDCSKTADDNAAELLDHAARLVAGSAFLWEMAAAAASIPLLAQLEESTDADTDNTAGAMPDLSPIASKLRRAGVLRTEALVPNTTATAPDEWDQDEDGVWEPPMVDGGDGQQIGTFFQTQSRSRPCGYPAEGLVVLREMMAARGVMHQELKSAVAGHPSLSDVWENFDEKRVAAR